MVKVCGITRRQDAEVAVAAGASAIGFIFYPQSPRYVTPEIAAELGRGLDVWKVGVFVDESPASIEAVMRAAHLDVAQIYGGGLPNVPRIWRALRLVGQTSRSARDLQIPLEVEAILLDGPANGMTFDWNQARGVSEKLGVPEKLILAGGLTASNVAEAIRVAKPWGVDASSGLELSPGIKDHDKVREFVKAAQDAS